MIPSTIAWAAHHTRQAIPVILERGIPIAMAATIATILAFSDVTPNLIIASGRWAITLLIAYAATMAALAIRPDEFRLHRIALPLGIGAWMGRGFGFLTLVIDLGRYDLLGAVAERAVIVALLLYFHSTEVRRHTHRKVVASV